MEWFILPIIDTTGIGDGTNDQPVFRATTNCPDNWPWLVAGIVIGAGVVYLSLKR